jgi:hypothetical protein
MKTMIKLILAGATLASVGVANAAGPIAVTPATGGETGSDLVLFVTDTANNATFTQDLGVNVNSLGVTQTSVAADVAANKGYSIGTNDLIGSLSNPVGSNGVDSALASFLGANSGGTFVYGILGASIGNGTASAGEARSVSTISGTPTDAVNGTGNSGLLYGAENSSPDAVTASQSVNSWFGAVNLGNPGGTAYGAKSGGNGLQAAQTLGTANDYALGTSVYLYEIASTGNSNQDAYWYASSTAISVSATGVISGFAGTPPPPVPLPAAVWLFGSGILGLFGIGRRRVTASV